MVVITVIEKSRAPEKSQGDWGISFPSNPWASAATTSLWYCLTIVSTSRLQLPGWRRLYFSVMFQSSSTVSSRTLTILCGELVSKSSNSCFCIFYLTIILIHYQLDIRLPIKDHFRDDFSFYFYIREPRYIDLNHSYLTYISSDAVKIISNNNGNIANHEAESVKYGKGQARPVGIYLSNVPIPDFSIVISEVQIIWNLSGGSMKGYLHLINYFLWFSMAPHGPFLLILFLAPHGPFLLILFLCPNKG